MLAFHLCVGGPKQDCTKFGKDPALSQHRRESGEKRAGLLLSLCRLRFSQCVIRPPTKVQGTLKYRGFQTMGCGGSRNRGAFRRSTSNEARNRRWNSHEDPDETCLQYPELEQGAMRCLTVIYPYPLAREDTIPPPTWGKSSSAGPKTTFKLVLLGSHSVGKTCISLRYCRGWTNLNELPTVGASFYAKNLEVKGVAIKFEARFQASAHFRPSFDL